MIGQIIYYKQMYTWLLNLADNCCWQHYNWLILRQWFLNEAHFYYFSLFSSLVILLSVLPSIFIVPGVKSSIYYPVFILKVRFDKAIFILCERLSNSLWGSDILLFLELINIVSILFYNFTEFSKMLHIFLVISFARYKEYTICLISFSNFSDVLPAFTCASAIGNLWSIFLGLNIVRFELPKTLPRATRADILGICFPWIVLYFASDTIEE